MENEAKSDKARTGFRAKNAGLVMCLVVMGVVMALTARNRPKQCGCLPFSTNSVPRTAGPAATDFHEESNSTARPRLLDLGAGKCIPCKKMAPILDELKKEYKGRLDVVFMDVWQEPDAARQYGVQSIPTQIFFDAAGKELYRHQGFFAKDDILKKWDELGIDLER